VFIVFFVAAALHHSFLIREVLLAHCDQVFKTSSPVADLEDTLKEALVFRIQVIIEHFERFVPTEWLGDWETLHINRPARHDCWILMCE